MPTDSIRRPLVERNSARLAPVLLGVMLAVSAGLVSGFGTVRDVAAASPPPYFLSNYVSSLNYSQWETYGCQQVEYSTSVYQAHGISPTVGISLILDFGTPADTGGKYGTWLPRNGSFAQWDSGGAGGIRFLLANFLTGYYDCSTGSSPWINLTVGTNNSGSAIENSTNASWMGDVVLQLDNWISSTGHNFIEEVTAGVDTETGWFSYANTIGYLNTLSADDGGMPIYDFGSASGCPETYQNANAACTSGWTQGQVLQVSWAAPWGLPLPEIYAGSGANAQEWYWISRLSVTTGHGAMWFEAELTQYTACSQLGTCGSGTGGTDNSPSTGWTQLYNALQQDGGIADGGTILWSDDIRYLPFP
jgi:hypothetical protein